MDEKMYDGLKLENQICFPLYAASREIIRQYRPFLENLDLTYTQYITMMVIWEVGRINVKDLGHRLHLDSGTLTPLLKCLENKGYVTRSRSHEDERVLNVELTESGEALREKAVGIPEKILECVNLDPDEINILYRILYKLLEAGENADE